MNTFAIRFPRQFGSFQLSVLMLVALLQRTPVLRLLASADSLWLRSSLGHVLRSSAVVASALGLVDTLAGATTFTTDPASPASATVGSPFAAAFALTGANGTVGSYTISGLPPGLAVPGSTASGGNRLLNNSTGTISGTPTTAGNYVVNITAWQFGNATGDSIPNNYTINVTGGAVVVAPTISSHPAGQSVTAGQSASFSVTATGTEPFTYQWRKDGNNIGGATSSGYSIASTVTGDAGDYSVVVTNSAGSATSNNAALTVTAAATAPSISSHPANQSVTAGQSASFSVTASGTAPLSYQWRKDGNNISGATASTHSIASVATGDAGTYSVVLTNSAGSATSNDATLTVTAAAEAPSITTQPASVTVTAGQSASFTAVAAGTAPLSYQWRKDGVNLPGATGATLIIASVSPSHAASYTVVATNAHGSVTSNPAVLAVVPARPAAFDAQAYLNQYPDVAAAIGPDMDGAWLHYLNQGINEGRVHDDLFRVDEYLELYADLRAGFGTNRQAALMHWFNTGIAAGRLGRVPKSFDAAAFLLRYGDLNAAFGSLPEAQRKVAVWNHYLNIGVHEGRNDGDFDAMDYLADHPDLEAAFGADLMAAAVHWYVQGRYEGRRIPAFFSVTGYFERNADIAAFFGADLYGAWLHYRDVGVVEGRSYNEEFRVDEYIAMYPDLQAAFGADRRSAMLHWLQAGRNEERAGRVPTAFDHTGYFTRNPDVAASLASLSIEQQRISAWTHFFYNGVREGRNFDDLFRVNEYLALYPDLQAAYGTKLGRVAFHWLIAGKLEGRRGRN